MSNLTREQLSSGDHKKNYGSVGEYLDDRSVRYELLQAPETAISMAQAAESLKLPLAQTLRTVLMKDEEGFLLVITSCDKVIDYPELCRSLHRDLSVVSINRSPLAHFCDKLLLSYPPLPGLLNVSALLDIKVNLENDKFYFPTGSSRNIAVISGQDAQKLMPGLWKEAFSTSITDLIFCDSEVSAENVLAVGDRFTPRRMEERVKETFEMPLMPPMADELLKLRVDPTAEAKDLARLVAKDPSLSAQLISWACSPYYGYPGKITSIDDAIIKVLGYDLVMNIALGIAIGQVMRVPNEGPIGLYNYWKHAIYTATLVERLVGLVPRENRPFRGLAYLCGLLHNFGYLLLGQLFPPQFYTLNQSVMANPTINVAKLEKQLFSVDHQQLGAWLMKAWHMPEELIVAMRYHHQNDFKGEYAIYAKLTYLSNQLLAEKNIGDEVFNQINFEKTLDSLNISCDDAQAIRDNLWEHREGLEEIIKVQAKKPQ